LIILSYIAVFPLIEFLLAGQKFISTLLSDILTILGIIWACKLFLDCFNNQIEKKQPSSRVEKIYVKTSFNIPLSVNQLENKVVVTTVITMLRFTDNSVRGR